LLNSRGILFENLPHQWCGFRQAVRAQQGPRVEVTEFRRSASRGGQGIEDEDGCPHLLLLHQAAGVTDRDRLVHRVFGISTFIPLTGIPTRPFRHLRQLQERRGSLLAIPNFRGELTQPDDISFGTLERNNFLQDSQRIGLAPLF